MVDQRERTLHDYAIEFGEYLATTAERYRDLVNQAEQPDAADAFVALNGAIYEFRKRAKRAAACHATPRRPAQRPVTEAEVEAATRTLRDFERCSVLQGFLYGNRHVIRDMRLPHDDGQEVWQITMADGSDFDRCHGKMMIEIDRRKMRAALEAARTVQS